MPLSGSVNQNSDNGVGNANLNQAINMIMNRLDQFQENQNSQYKQMSSKIEKIEKRINQGGSHSVYGQESGKPKP